MTNPRVDGGRSGPDVFFVNGFPRSGTTVMATALTAAVGGVTTTAGVLARDIPALADFLQRQSGSDRGVDRLVVTADTVEEYGYLLNQRTGRRSCYGDPRGVDVLRRHVTELAAEAPGAPVVLKNPQDFGAEARLLRDFPGSGILLLRRRLSDIDDSVLRAMRRVSESGGYPQAVAGGHDDRLPAKLASPWRRALLRAAVRWYLYLGVLRLIRSVRTLPPGRVAFLDHAEMCADARAGAQWAAHLVDPDALAAAYRGASFGERQPAASAGPVARQLDRLWDRAWQRARTRQNAIVPSHPQASS